MHWIFLLIAGLMEIGWPVGLKLAQNAQWRWQGVVIAVLCMVLSGAFLFLAQKSIPMGTAYAVWTGIGALGAFVVGIVFYQDPATVWRWLGALLIVSGVVVMKLSAVE